MTALTESVCIVDGHHGIYVPQVWAERYGTQAAESAGVRADDVSTLILGPDVDDYWESWERVLNYYCHEVDGVKHYLIQDEDLFEYPETCAFAGWLD
jgi:hypothetical protein